MKPAEPSFDPLPNPRHEAFAREIASGKSATQAYCNVYGTQNRHVASTGGSRLLRKKPIAARIRALQKAGAARVVLDLAETLDFLARVVRTPAGDVIPSSDLCTRVKRTRDGSFDVWMPDKLACLRLSAKLQGFFNSSRTASAARTASPTETPVESGEPQPSHTGVVLNLTQELLESLIARRNAVILERAEEQQQPFAEVQSPAQEQCLAQKQSPIEEHSPAELQSPAEKQRRPFKKRRAKAPTTACSITPPASPEGCRTVAGAWTEATPPEPVPPKRCPPNRAPNPEHHTANPARLSTLNPQQFTQSPRVTPEDSSVLIII